jgi:DNA-binding transcriptional regulator YdaS (Cro superfamily)
MKLGDWLRTHRITQDAFGARIGVTQGRVSQIVADGTNDLSTALAIQKETEGEVTVDELLPQRKSSPATSAAAGEAA